MKLSRPIFYSLMVVFFLVGLAILQLPFCVGILVGVLFKGRVIAQLYAIGITLLLFVCSSLAGGIRLGVVEWRFHDVVRLGGEPAGVVGNFICCAFLAILACNIVTTFGGYSLEEPKKPEDPPN